MSEGSLLDKWKSRKANQSRQIAPAPLEAMVPPTSGQARLWMLQQLYPDNPFYQYAHVFRISGSLDPTVMSQAVDQLVLRHEILRTNFLEEGAELRLQVQEWKTECLNYDAPAPDVYAPQQQEQLCIEEVALTPYGLEHSPLFRARLLRLGAENWTLVLGMHHIIGDRSSLLLLKQELFQTYQSIVAGQPVDATAPSIGFRDYAYWRSQQPINETDLNYWKQQLAGDIPIPALPTDRQRTTSASFEGGSVQLQLEAELSATIRAQCRQNSITPNVFFLTAFKVWLSLYGRERDIAVGSPFSVRDRVQLQDLIGFMNETSVLRTQLDPDISWREALRKVQQTFTDALSHKNLPFGQLVQELAPRRSPNRNPFFQHMFVYANQEQFTTLPGGWTIQDEPYQLPTAKFDLTLFATELEDGFQLDLEYASDLFAHSTAERMLGHLSVMLEQAVKHPESIIGELPIMTKEEEKLVVHKWNETVSLPDDFPATVVDMIYRAAAKNPNAIAVADQATEISYAQLIGRANYLAEQLRAAGTQPGELIGLCLERGANTLVGLLGILLAGGAYVPLDPDYPVERLKLMAEDAGIQRIVTDPSTEQNQAFTASYTAFVVPTVLSLSANVITGSAVEVSGDQPAYLIYTSGSTGRPKGVLITHANLRQSTASRFAFYQHQPAVFLLLSSFNFDSSVAGIFWTLCQGGMLFVPPTRIEQDISKLGAICQEKQVSHTLLLPSLYQLLLEFVAREQLSSLQTVMVAGEACPSQLVATHYQILPKVELVNEYGPTEATVWSTAHQLNPEDAQAARVPIGRPIPASQNYVLNQRLRPVPAGVIGELYIGGAGISPGYWQRPDLTSERFLADPFRSVNEARIYRTGDLVRYRTNGTIEFLGRADRQLKIRGFRVEPDELKKVLAAYPGVQEAIVKVHQTEQQPQLLAYLVTNNAIETNLAVLQRELAEQLPDYLLPSGLQLIEEVPRLPNGKVNYAALPIPEIGERTITTDARLPTSALEQQLVGLWADILETKDIRAFDNFFNLGGDSLKSIRLIGQAKKLGLELSPTLLFRYPVLADLASALEADIARAAAGDEPTVSNLYDPIVPLKKTGHKPPLFCFHSGGGHVFFYQPLAQKLKAERPLYAIQPPGLDGGPQPFSSIEEMSTFYLQEIKKIQPKGPYHFLGSCFSNAICLELAKQLEAAGETIDHIFIIDSAPPHRNRSTFVEETPKARPVRNFTKRLLKGEFHGLYITARNRLIWRYRDLQSEVSSEKRNLFQTIKSLNQMFATYDPPQIASPITLIRSDEFVQLARKEEHLSLWRALTQSELIVKQVPGTHVNLFSEAEVGPLAEVINELLV